MLIKILKMKKLSFLAIIMVFVITLGKVNAQTNDTYKDVRDGKTYKTVKIGDQVWFAENLAYNAESGCWAYNDKVYNENAFGFLYNQKTAINVCPDGWRLPSKEDFETLLNNFGGAENWNYKNYIALVSDEASGFSAYFGGLLDASGNYDGIGRSGYFLSSSQDDLENIWYLNVNSHFESAGMDIYKKNMGFSVRCIKD